jgi:hypothetical protein
VKARKRVLEFPIPMNIGPWMKLDEYQTAICGQILQDLFHFSRRQTPKKREFKKLL